jgi:hypothetical protein
MEDLTRFSKKSMKLRRNKKNRKWLKRKLSRRRSLKKLLI